MADVLAWAAANWGYVTLASTTAAGFGTAFKFWLDLGAERRANAADKREQAKAKREEDFHPLELESRRQALTLNEIKIKQETLELMKRSKEVSKPGTDRQFQSQVSIIALRLAWDCQSLFGPLLAQTVSNLYTDLRTAMNWSDDGAEAQFLLAANLQPHEVRNSPFPVRFEFLSALTRAGLRSSAMISTWLSRSTVAHRKDPNQSVEEIYQAFRTEMDPQRHLLTASAHEIFANTDWVDDAVREGSAEPPRIWETPLR